jgi:hypothetical protein
MIREPVVAGAFYPGTPDECAQQLDGCLSAAAENAPEAGAERVVGGIVPHAGWMFSGRVAARALASIAAQRRPSVAVVFGAMHRVRGRQAALFASGAWESPLGRMIVDRRLAERVLGHTNLIVSDPYAHEAEHSIEVIVPFVQRLMPDCMLLPMLVPPMPQAAEMGRTVARTLESYRYDAVVIGSSDLTHYGPRYQFTPQGVGAQANRWAKDVNDAALLRKILALDAVGALTTSSEDRSACGGGAIAATIAAVEALGATRAALLEHTCSAEVLSPQMEGEDSVGYAGVVFATN